MQNGPRSLSRLLTLYLATEKFGKGHGEEREHLTKVLSPSSCVLHSCVTCVQCVCACALCRFYYEGLGIPLASPWNETPEIV